VAVAALLPVLDPFGTPVAHQATFGQVNVYVYNYDVPRAPSPTPNP
jgi:hypothetical protein